MRIFTDRIYASTYIYIYSNKNMSDISHREGNTANMCKFISDFSDIIGSSSRRQTLNYDLIFTKPSFLEYSMFI